MCIDATGALNRPGFRVRAAQADAGVAGETGPTHSYHQAIGGVDAFTAGER